MSQRSRVQVSDAAPDGPSRRPVLAAIRGRLVVSCQALEGLPFNSPAMLAEMARAAELGGAIAIRANRPENIRAIRDATSLPIIGLFKQGTTGVYITPTRASALACVEAGSDMVALDATSRPRPNGERLADIVEALHQTGVEVLGDVGNANDARRAAEAGVDAVATTLRGHTEGPTLDPLGLLRTVLREVDVPVVMEGGVISPQIARQGIEHGAWSVVVGRAITMPHFVTEMYVRELSLLSERTVFGDDD